MSRQPGVSTEAAASSQHPHQGGVTTLMSRVARRSLPPSLTQKQTKHSTAGGAQLGWREQALMREPGRSGSFVAREGAEAVIETHIRPQVRVAWGQGPAPQKHASAITLRSQHDLAPPRTRQGRRLTWEVLAAASSGTPCPAAMEQHQAPLVSFLAAQRVWGQVADLQARELCQEVGEGHPDSERN